MTSLQQALDFAQQESSRFESQLKEILRIPSISTLPEHAEDVRRAADWLLADMRRIGLQAKTYEQPGFLPLVYGEWLGAGENAPTVLVYCHYDVQPAEMVDGWVTNPFEPVEKDGKIYARGAVDSKSHVLIQLKAAESLLSVAGGSPVNIKLLFEGEEESGSEHIFNFVRDQPDMLRSDVIIVSDGSMPDVNQPVLVYGLRGIIMTELLVTGPARDLHSGHYGGSVHNPAQALAEIIAGLHDAQGHVTVPGFYDSVRPMDEEERAELRRTLPWIESEWGKVTEAPAHWGEPEFTLLERIGARPTLEINGMAGGFHGFGFKTVLPAKAVAKISCRLVPDQDPADIFARLRDFIAKIAPPTVRTELRLLDPGAAGILVARDSAAMRAAESAYHRSWGVRPIFSREGGSIPVVEAFLRHLDKPLVMMPFGYKGCGAHGPNEHVYLEMFHKGIRAMLYFLTDLPNQTKG